MKNMEVSCTQDLPSNDLNHDLGTPKCELWKGGLLSSLSLKVEDNCLSKGYAKPSP